MPLQLLDRSNVLDCAWGVIKKSEVIPHLEVFWKVLVSHYIPPRLNKSCLLTANWLGRTFIQRQSSDEHQLIT